MKISVISALAVGLALVFASCSQPTSSSSTSSTSTTGTTTTNSTTYTNTVLPSTLSVKLPTSLTTTGGTTSDIAPSRAVSASTGTTTSGYSYLAGGYYQIKNMAKLTSTITPVMFMMGIVVDAMITQNKLTASTTVHPTESVTMTQGMLDAINAYLPASEQISASGTVGTSASLTNVTYASVPNSTLNSNFSGTMGSGNSSMTLTYQWSTDRSKVLMELTSGSTTMEITYDATSKSSAVEFKDGTGNVFKMDVQADASSTVNGVFAKMSFTLSTGGSYSIYGYADDKGGLTMSTITTTNVSYYDEEGFDNTGTLQYAAYSATSASTLTVDTVYNNANFITPYTTDLSTSSTMTFSADSLLV